VLTDLKKYLSKKAKVSQWFRGLIESIQSVEVGGIIKIPSEKEKDWQSILEKVLTDACRHQTDQLVFLWDEVPYMLQKISAIERRSGSRNNSALAIVDSLRALRNENPTLRMVFTGSVGLHHVLQDLRDGEFASQPTNDMEKVEIGPLTLHYARALARTLLHREDIRCTSEDAVVERIVELTDRVPFYIHRVVTRMALLEEDASPKTVEEVVDRQLTDVSDPWEMEHFRNRLNIYYRKQLASVEGKVIEAASVAKALLNHIAAEAHPQSIDECYADLKSRMRFQDRDEVVQILNSLAKDYYLTRNSRGRYEFRFPLVRKWWTLAQGLAQ